MVQLNCQEETTNSENPLLRQEQPVGVWRSHCRNSRRTERVSTDRNKRWRWSRKDFWSIQGDFICRHHSEPRVQLCVPNEEVFPMKYIDVTRATYANLDVLQEKRKDDYWNVHANRSLSGSWTGFTKLTLLRETSNMIYVVWRDTDNRSSNYRPENVACSMDPNWKSRSKERKTRVGNRAAKTEKIKKPSKMRGESWKFQWRS